MRPPPLTDSLRSAYSNARYRILTDPPVALRVGLTSTELSHLLRRHGAEGGVLLTACNPFSRPLTHAENERRTATLISWLEGRGLNWLPAEGGDPDEEWPAERSVFVFDAGAKVTDEMLREFEQHAVVVVSQDAIPRLAFHPAHETCIPSCSDR